MAKFDGGSEYESFENILKNGSSVVIIYIVEFFDPTSHSAIKQHFDLKIYSELYDWIYSGVSLPKLTQNLLRIFEDPAIILDIYNQCAKILTSLGTFNEFVKDVINIKNCIIRYPSLCVLYKVKFFKTIISLNVDEKLSTLEIFHVDILNIIENLRSDQFSCDMTSVFFPLTAALPVSTVTPENLNYIIDNMDTLIKTGDCGFKSKNLLIFVLLLSMKESEIFQRHGLCLESTSKILSFLYNSFKIKIDKLICLALAVSINSLSKIKPYDQNLARIIQDLIKKAHSSNETKLLTYAHLMNLYIYNSPGIKYALEYLKHFCLTLESNFVQVCLIRAHLWSNAGHISISDAILQQIFCNYFEKHSTNKNDHLYESFMCIKSYNLFHKNEFKESSKLLRSHIVVNGSETQVLREAKMDVY